MARKKNPRVATVKCLRSMKKNIEWLIAMWTVSSNVYIKQSERDTQSQWRRKRLPHEYPENSSQHWDILAGECQKMIDDLILVRNFALHNLAELKEDNSK